MELTEHSGFMEYEDGTFEVLHANWPNYPAGHGWPIALQSLAMFPRSARFVVDDDIDQCFLLRATGFGSCSTLKPEQVTKHGYFVAIWREDLNQLYERHHVSGIALITEYERALAWWNRHKELCVQEGSNFRPINLPRPEPEDFCNDRSDVPAIAPEGIALTDEGAQAIFELSHSLNDIWPTILERIRPLLAIAYYDTAVREACIILETRLRKIVGTRSFGQDLVEEYCTSVVSRYMRAPSAFLCILRGELRTVFKFVRNEYAHSLHEITEIQCLAFLSRITQVLERIDQVEQGTQADQELDEKRS
jgi:hypothetical protein